MNKRISFGTILLLTTLFVLELEGMNVIKRCYMKLCCGLNPEDLIEEEESLIMSPEAKEALMIQRKEYGPNLAKLMDSNFARQGYTYHGNGTYIRTDWHAIYSYQRLCCEPYGNVISK